MSHKSSSSSRARGTKAFGVLVAAGLVSGLLFVTASAQQPTAPATAAPSPPPSVQPDLLSPEERQKREEWRRSMSRNPAPKKGCFNSSYPSLEWHEVPCGAPSQFPNPPARGPRPDFVGNGTDFSARVSGAAISSAIGSFDSVSPATITETGAWGNNSNAANAFTLQINSQFFSTPACNNRAGCQGWQQFIYSQNQCNGPCVFMEYWLIGFGPSCPAGSWRQSGNDCWFNSASTRAPAVTAAQLQGTTLTGTAASGGTDTVVLSTAGGTATAMAADDVVSLEQQWNTAEFNIFGDCCLAQANFSIGSTIVVRTSIVDGTMNAPACVSGGTTGETNNLKLVGPCSAIGGASPAIVFTESFMGPPAASAPFVDTFSNHYQQHFAYLATNANGRNGEIWDVFYCPGPDDCDQVWQLQKINGGGVTNGPPAASAPFVNSYFGHDQQHFAYLATTDGASGEIWDAFYCPDCSGNKWKLQKINSGGVTDGPPAVSGPFVDTYSEANQQHFAYLAANGEIWDAYYCPDCSGNKWKLQKINSGGVTNGPPAASAPFVNVYSGHNQQHFAYLATTDGASGEIWDAYYCPDCSGNKWKLQKINSGGVTDGPPAVSGPFVDTYQGANQQHFAYLAANGEIWDAYYCPDCSGNKWKLQKINSGGVTDGPPAASAPFVNESWQQHFAYLAANGEIWDAYYWEGHKWLFRKINSGGVTNGPPATSAPFLNVFVRRNEAYGGQHFAYLAANGEIWDAYECVVPHCFGYQLQQLAGQ